MSKRRGDLLEKIIGEVSILDFTQAMHVFPVHTPSLCIKCTEPFDHREGKRTKGLGIYR